MPAGSAPQRSSLSGVPFLASVGSSLTSFFDAVGQFFSSIAGLNWIALVLALAAFAVYLLLRSRAIFVALGAAYPTERFEFKRVWGAYMAAYGLNQVLPAGGGNVLQLVLVRNSIPNATYPTVGAALATAIVFDTAMNVLVAGYCFTQGVFPKPPDLSKI